MDPSLVGTAQWQTLGQVVLALTLFVGLAINAAFAFLTSHAIIPSLLDSGDAPRSTRLLRWFLYPIFAVSLVLAAVALTRGLMMGLGFLNSFYPRYEY